MDSPGATITTRAGATHAHCVPQAHPYYRAARAHVVHRLLREPPHPARCGSPRWRARDRVHGQGGRHPGPALSRDHDIRNINQPALEVSLPVWSTYRIVDSTSPTPEQLKIREGWLQR